MLLDIRLLYCVDNDQGDMKVGHLKLCRGDDVLVLLVSMAWIGSAGDFHRMQYRAS